MTDEIKMQDSFDIVKPLFERESTPFFCGSREPFLALSVKAPYSWLICVGLKDVENRAWKIGRKTSPAFGQKDANFSIKLPARIYIHSSKTPDGRAAYSSVSCILRDQLGDELWKREWSNFWYTPEKYLGAIIGEVTIVDCVKDSKSRWAVPGQYHFILEKPRLYDKPIPYRGQLGFFFVNMEGIRL